MFKNSFLKQVVTICICLTSAVCSYGQGGGIIDVVFNKNNAETHELTIYTSVENEVKISLMKSDGTLYLERFLYPGEVLTENLPSGTYQLYATEYITAGRNRSYFLLIED